MFPKFTIDIEIGLKHHQFFSFIFSNSFGIMFQLQPQNQIPSLCSSLFKCSSLKLCLMDCCLVSKVADNAVVKTHDIIVD